jgi:hypothetical protein
MRWDPSVRVSPWVFEATLEGADAAPKAAPPPASTRSGRGHGPWSQRRGGADSPQSVRDHTLLHRSAHQLLWFHPRALRRLRREPWYAELYRTLAEAEPDAELDSLVDDDDPAAAEEHREMHQVLTHARLLAGSELTAAFRSSCRSDGKFVPAVAVLAGYLVPLLDERASLRMTLDVIKAADFKSEALHEAAARAEAMLELQALAPAAAARHHDDLLRALGKTNRSTAARRELEAQAQELAVAARAYRRCQLFGGEHLVVTFEAAGSSGPVPAYLPSAVASLLPLRPRLEARVVAEIHMRQDEREHDPLCLRVLALARTTQF